MVRSNSSFSKSSTLRLVFQHKLCCEIRKYLTLDLLLPASRRLSDQMPKKAHFLILRSLKICGGWQSCWWHNLFLAEKQGKTLRVRQPTSKTQPVIWNRPENDGKQDAWLLFVGLAHKLCVKPVTEDKPCRSPLGHCPVTHSPSVFTGSTLLDVGTPVRKAGEPLSCEPQNQSVLR